MIMAQDQAAFIPEIESIAKELIKIKIMLDSMKPLYEKMDKLTLQLKDLVGESGSVTVNFDEEERILYHNGEAHFIEPEKTVYIVDNFAKKNTVFRPAGVKRFEATLDDPNKNTKYKK